MKNINKKDIVTIIIFWIIAIALVCSMPTNNVISTVIWLIGYIILTIINKEEIKKLILIIYLMPLIIIFIYLPAYTSSILNNKFGIVKEDWFLYLGTIIGAAIGVLGAYLIMKMQLINSEKQKSSEIENEIEIAKLIVESFLFDEIKSNYIKLTQYGAEFANNFKNDCEENFKWNISFVFKEFDEIKYNIIKYNNKPIKDVLEIYRTFKVIQEFKRYGDLSDSQKKQINKGLKLCEKFLEKENTTLKDQTLKTGHELARKLDSESQA